MIASSSSYSGSTLDITDTTSSSDCTATVTEYYDTPYSYVKEEEVEQEILPPKVDISFKSRNISYKNRLNSKNKFRTHRTRNR